MAKIVDIKVETFPRREFIKRLVRMGRMGLLGATGMALLNRCVGSVPLFDDLDPPFVCLTANGCNSGLGSPFDYTNGTGPTNFVFSGYNPESGFSGYNIWYGNNQTTLINNHSSGDRSLVLNQAGSLDVTNIGGTSLPSFATSATVNQTSFVSLTIDFTVVGFYIYVTAYSTSDGIDSPLSNVVDTSTI